MTPFWDDRMAQWVSGRIEGCARGFGECRAMGVEHRGEIVAGLVFHNWEPTAQIIEISAAATRPGWMTRRVMNLALTYTFDGLGCQAVITNNAETNMPARRIWQALGAEEHVIPRLRGRDKAGCLYVLTDDAWARSKFNGGK